MNKKGKVYLIGAGPGDPGLFTIRGKECLEKADVIVYDYLVNPRLLQHARGESEIIYVGKRSGSKEMSQENINRLLVHRAKEGKIVARLKGGDPFIFGRGGEEAEELFKSGIPFEVVPGVTSASAVPAYAGIPLTHRDFNSSFAVVTGHEDPTKEESNLPWESLSKIRTVVFLMGVKNIEENMKKLIEFGKSPQTPVALITWGTLPKQRTITGNIEEIGRIVKEKKVKSPAIIVVGEVVGLREILNWFETKPLFGKKVIVTRTRIQASVLVKLLEEEGAEAIEFPTIEIVPPESWDEMDRAIENLDTYSWVIFTSVNGVQIFFERLKGKKKNIMELKGIRIATIGEQTGRAVENLGLSVDVIPYEFRAEGIIENFREIDIKGKRILIPRAKEAREILPLELQRMGAEVHVVTAYETKKPNAKKVGEVKEMLRCGEIDVVTFASSSTVRNFLSIFEDEKLLLKSTIACIGPITAEPLREIGIEPQIIPKKYTIEELVKEIVNYFLAIKHK
jgi:uroporphyrinogen III methyltransferase / synthase